MGARCTVCDHAERSRIELGLSRKVSYAKLARKFSVSKDAVARHRTNHVPPQLLASLAATGAPTVIDLEALRQSESEGVLQHLVALRARLFVMLENAEKTVAEFDDVRAAISVHGQIQNNLQLTAKLLGELQVGNTTVINNLIVSEDWIVLRGALIKALSPHPEARRAVADVLRDIEGGPPHYTGVHDAPIIEHETHAVG